MMIPKQSYFPEGNFVFLRIKINRHLSCGTTLLYHSFFKVIHPNRNITDFLSRVYRPNLHTISVEKCEIKDLNECSNISNVSAPFYHMSCTFEILNCDQPLFSKPSCLHSPFFFFVHSRGGDLGSIFWSEITLLYNFFFFLNK